MEDMFVRLFELQHDLQTKVYGHPDLGSHRKPMEETVEYIAQMQQAAVSELHEALNEVGWKPWATSKHINRDAYLSELIDALQFWMNMVLAVGGEPKRLAEELFNRYTLKRHVNIQRHNDHYDGVLGKCPSCKRSYDDSTTMCRKGTGDNWYCVSYQPASPGPDTVG